MRKTPAFLLAALFSVACKPDSAGQSAAAPETQVDSGSDSESERRYPKHARGFKHLPPIYDAQMDVDAQLSASLAAAKAENKRVLVMYGANWCHWCWKLHGTLESEAVKPTLDASYVLMLIDMDTFEDFPDRFDANVRGFPYLTVLDAEGKVVVNQGTGKLESGRAHDPEKVKAFLEEWKAPAAG